MIYAYKCQACGKSHDIIKPVADFDREEVCPTCSLTMQRAVCPVKIHLYGTAVQEKKYQPALGRAATDNELKTVARARGWEEVGTEDPSKHLKPKEAEYPTFSDEDLRSMNI